MSITDRIIGLGLERHRRRFGHAVADGDLRHVHARIAGDIHAVSHPEPGQMWAAIKRNMTPGHPFKEQDDVAPRLKHVVWRRRVDRSRNSRNEAVRVG